VRPVDEFAATQRCQVVKWTSAIGWKFAPSARIRQAWSGRAFVLSETSGGIEM